jgi:hypothetical protein
LNIRRTVVEYVEARARWKSNLMLCQGTREIRADDFFGSNISILS